MKKIQSMGVFLLMLSLGVLGCHKKLTHHHIAVEKPKHSGQRTLFQGYFSYMADANYFISCDETINYPVAMQGAAYLNLEKSYLRLNLAPQKVYVEIYGEIQDMGAQQPELGKKHIVVHDLKWINPAAKCNF